MDRTIRCIITNGSIMVSAVEITDIVCMAQQIRRTGAVTTAVLGRLLSAASLTGNMFKKKDAVIVLKIKGDGPAGVVMAIVGSTGNCRGYVEHLEVSLPNKSNGEPDVGAAVGADGLLSVMRDLSEGEPYVSQVELVSGEIGEDTSQYFAVSEQVPTICALGVPVGKESGQSLLSDGMLVQVLPGVDGVAIAKLERNAVSLEPVITMLAKGMSVEEMCHQVLDGFETEILDESPVKYVCTCSADRVTRMLSTLHLGDVRTLADENGKMEAKCQYRAKAYESTQEQLSQLADSVEREYGQKQRGKMSNQILKKFENTC